MSQEAVYRKRHIPKGYLGRPNFTNYVTTRKSLQDYFSKINNSLCGFWLLKISWFDTLEKKCCPQNVSLLLILSHSMFSRLKTVFTKCLKVFRLPENCYIFTRIEKPNLWFSDLFICLFDATDCQSLVFLFRNKFVSEVRRLKLNWEQSIKTWKLT